MANPKRSTTAPNTFSTPFGQGLRLRACPYPNSGHRPVGGVQKHSAGDIFPYIIVKVGNFVDGFKWHLTGNGLKVGDAIYDTYANAHAIAVLK